MKHHRIHRPKMEVVATYNVEFNLRRFNAIYCEASFQLHYVTLRLGTRAAENESAMEDFSILVWFKTDIHIQKGSANCAGI